MGAERTLREFEIGVESLELEEEEEGSAGEGSGAKSSRVRISRRRGKFQSVACWKGGCISEKA